MHNSNGVLNGARHSRLFYEEQAAQAKADRRVRAATAQRAFLVEIAHGNGGHVLLEVQAASEAAARSAAYSRYAQMPPAERDRRAVATDDNIHRVAPAGSVKRSLIGTRERAVASQGIDLGAQRLLSTAASSDVGTESRSVALTFSSEARVARPYGIEILSHKRGAADMERMNNGAPLLFNHNMDDVIGVVESASIGDDRRGHATVRFAKTQRGNDVLGMVQDRILRNVSIMYSIDDIDDSKPGEYLVTRWQPLELSIVTVPADASVGVGRTV